MYISEIFRCDLVAIKHQFSFQPSIHPSIKHKNVVNRRSKVLVVYFPERHTLMRYRNVAKLKLYLLEQDASSFAQLPVWYYVKSRSGLSVNTVLQLWQIFYKFFWQNILSSATNEDDSLRTHCTCLRANPLVIVGPRKGKCSDKFFTRVGWVLKYHSFELAWNIITLKWACPTLFLSIEHKQKIFSIKFCKYLYHSFEQCSLYSGTVMARAWALTRFS